MNQMDWMLGYIKLVGIVTLLAGSTYAFALGMFLLATALT
jgi:hypothetical protein